MRIFSDEHRRKLSEAASRRVYTDELREKRRQQMRSQPGRNLGRKFSISTRARMSAAGIGRVFTKEHRQALSVALKGHAPNPGSHKSKAVRYKGITLASSYELEVAKYLDSIGEKWRYVGRSKADSFLLYDGRRYYPDFFLPRLNIYIDPKGFDRDPYKRELVEWGFPGKVRFLIGKDYLEQLKQLLACHS